MSERVRERYLGMQNRPFTVRSGFAPGYTYTEYKHNFDGIYEYTKEVSTPSGKNAIDHRVYTNEWYTINFWNYSGLEYVQQFICEPVGTDFGISLAEAISIIRPKLMADFSLLNFFWELKDFRTLLPSLLESSKIFSTLIPFLPSKKKRIRDIERLSKISFDKARDATYAASGVYLTNAFAIKPFISDIANAIEAWNTFEIQLKRFIKNSNKPQKRHVKKKFPNIDPKGSPENILYPVWNTAFSQHAETTASDRTQVWTIEYTYSIAEKIPSMPKLFSRFIGLRKDPRIVWNALPWSFVFDWLVKINDWLSQFDPGALKINLEILNATCSWKGVSTLKVYHKALPDWNSRPENALLQVPGYTLGYLGTCRSYVRNVITDKALLNEAASQILPLRAGDPGTNQMFLSLALLSTLTGKSK